jgi:bifunctional DNA-binding transcriptional regulator/antitoxin component of YhaV-PrlF toxin-antitoxin module
MPTIKLTSKRQATFPRKVCEELNLKPGDPIELVPKVLDGHRVWILQTQDAAETPWFARLGDYAKGKRHDMDAVRKSIAEARTRGDL